MRSRLALIPLLAFAALLTALGSVAQAKPLIGLADQNGATLQDSRYKALKIKNLRTTISYDQIRKGGSRLASQDFFLNTANAEKKSILVTFYRTASAKPSVAAKRLPTVSEFQKDFERFRIRYPFVKKFSTWNEENFPKAQPTGRNPKRTAQFYLMLRKECKKRTLSVDGKSANVAPCTVLTGDFRANGSSFD